MTDYSEYTHIKIYLSDVLAELDDARESLTHGLLRVKADATEESLKQQIGIIQGFQKASEQLKRTFGAL